MTGANYHHKTLQTSPLVLFVQSRYLMDAHRPDLTLFFAMMPRFCAFIVTILNTFKVIALSSFKPLLDLIKQGGMVGFERQDVICSFGANTPSNLMLSPHRINRNDAPSNIQQFE